MKYDRFLITPGEYFENIEGFQFVKVIDVEDKFYLKELSKDLAKEYHSDLGDNELRLKLTENISEGLRTFESTNRYFVLDKDSLGAYLRPVLMEFLADFVYFIDEDDNKKFELLYKLLRQYKTDFIVKVRKEPRNLQLYPIYKKEVDDQIMLIGDYEHKIQKW